MTKRVMDVPRWAKILLILVALAGLLVLVMMLAGGPTGHGPWQHGAAVAP